MHELTKQTPVAILAEALGYRPETLETHATTSGANYGRCVADCRARCVAHVAGKSG
jgi:hypothetical protein